MSALRRIVLGDGSLGSTVGTLLFIGIGLAFVWLGVSDLNEALRQQPVPLQCGEFLAAPGATARWVALSGCRLDLPGAASRRWKGSLPGQSRVDGGARGMTLELFIPLSARDAPASERPTAVLATTDKQLLGLVDQIGRLDTRDRVDAFLQEHQAEFDTLLSPEPLIGYVEPIASSASRAALGVITAEGAVVLEQGRQPQRLNSVCTVLFGMALLVWGLMPIARRWRLEKESQPP